MRVLWEAPRKNRFPGARATAPARSAEHCQEGARNLRRPGGEGRDTVRSAETFQPGRAARSASARSSGTSASTMRGEVSRTVT